jgi:hypothetical protein
MAASKGPPMSADTDRATAPRKTHQRKPMKKLATLILISAPIAAHADSRLWFWQILPWFGF